MSAQAILTTLAGIPFTPTTETGRGYLGPLMRTIGHLMWLLVAINEATPLMTPDEQQAELTHAANHLAGAADTSKLPLTRQARTLLDTFKASLEQTRDEWTGWSLDDQKSVANELANRVAGLASALDFELLGIPDADPGSSF